MPVRRNIQARARIPESSIPNPGRGLRAVRYIARPGTEAHVANVIDLIGEWHTYRRATGASLNGAVGCLLDRVDWDCVDEHALRLAFRILLANVPAVDAASISAGADKERKILTEYAGDHALGLSDADLLARLPERDRLLVRMFEQLRPNPQAFRAAVTMLKALGRGPKPRRARMPSVVRK
jgi:hypothetical protein